MIESLFIVKRRPSPAYGTFGLINSARFVCEEINRYRGIPIKARMVEVNDNNDIDREVFYHKPHVVVLEALWVVPEKLDILCKKYYAKQWIIRVHSKIPFLANEGIAFQWMNGIKKVNEKYQNIWLACNNEQTYYEMKEFYGDKVLYLPNIYNLPHARQQHGQTPKDKQLHVGCFGAIRPMKNQLMQAVSAILYANRKNYTLFFHMNTTRLEQGGDNIYKNIEAAFLSTKKHRLVTHDWYSHEYFVNKIVPSMDIGMQVSFSESFNIVAADFVNAGVPIVVSPDISWMPFWAKADPNSSNSIMQKLRLNLAFRDLGIVDLNKRALRRHNQASLATWINALENFW